jgi:hypothetical protein
MRRRGEGACALAFGDDAVVRKGPRRASLVLVLVCAVAAAIAAVAIGAKESPASTVHTYVFRVGPVPIGAYEVRYNPGRSAIPAPPVSGFVTDMSARIVDARGNPVPVTQIMLHHVIFSNAGSRGRFRRDGTCATAPQRFYGTGEERETMRMPPGYGYRFSRTDRWEVAWMLMNHQPRPEADYIEYRVTVDTSSSLTAVTPYWLSIVPCSGDPIFNVVGGGAPGSTAVFAHTWTVPADGRIIASGAHVHGGDKAQILSQPGCGNRELIDTRPLYGLPSNIVYHVLPVLHEPGPIGTDWFESQTGIPIHRGERLQVVSAYDGQYVHTRAMGLLHVYVAPPTATSPSTPACARLPADVRYLRPSGPGEPRPPHVVVPLIGFGPGGGAHVIDRPAGAFWVLPSGGTVRIKNFSFDHPDVALPVGGRLQWTFGDSTPHNVTVADGPRGFASVSQTTGGRFSYQFTVPGTYRLFCSLHPWMTEVVVVGKHR